MPVDELTPKKKVKELKEQAEKLKPITPPPGYVLSVNKPSLLHQFRDSVANSAIGHALENATPRIADALDLHPSEVVGTPDYERHKEQLLNPEAFAPAVHDFAQELQGYKGAGTVPNIKHDASAPSANEERAQGVLRAAGGMTTGKSLGTLGATAVAAGLTAGVVNPASAQILSRLVSGGFTLDMLHSLYQQHGEYRKAVDSGNMAEAHKIQGEMGVTGIMALMTGKHALTSHPFTPIAEAPSRARTNVIHRNTAGEVRQAPGQAPTVWLNPESWKSFMGGLYPGEDATATHGVNLPANEHLHAFANDTQLSAANPQFGEVQKLLAEAHKNGSGGGIAIANTRPSIQANVNVMREELNHTWQRSLSTNGKFDDHLKPGIFSDLRRNIPQGMHDHLLDNGYDEYSSPQMVTEAAAKFMGGNPEKFGVSPEEAADFMHKYYTEVAAQHGSEALNSLKHVKGVAKDAKEAVHAEHANGARPTVPDGGLGDGRTDRGNIQGLAKGGQGRTTESIQGEKPSGEGQDPLFNRDKEKPTWYLKSEQLIGDKMRGPQPAQDVHKMLISGGVKPEEMQWTGLDDFLQSKGKDKVTPEEVREHLANNNVQLKEVTKGEKLSEDERKRYNTLLGDSFHLSDPERQEFNALSQKESESSPTKYSKYTLPGAENYREMLLTMPHTPFVKSEVPTLTFEQFAKDNPELAKEFNESLFDHADRRVTPEERDVELNNILHSQSRYVDDDTQATIRQKYKSVADAHQNNTEGMRKSSQKSFRSNHWDEPNILAHVRFNDRTGPNGEKLLHVEEVQSDMMQSMRKQRDTIAKTLAGEGFYDIIKKMQDDGTIEVEC